MRSYIHAVITGRRRGLWAELLRWVLGLASMIYVILHDLRRFAYRISLFRSVRLPVPVISVGNLTTGGTGKTPFVEYLARWFSRHNVRTAILARGYGKLADGRDDEQPADVAMELVKRFTGADRVALAREALATFRPGVILLDDGFQHYRIARDLDLLLIDATDPFANGRRLPAGLLREAPSASRRADAIILTRADQAEADDLAALRLRLSTLAPGKALLEARHRAVDVRTIWNRKPSALEWLGAKRVLAFCGVGNPEAFRRTLAAAGTTVVRFVAFPDHHRYTAGDLRRLNAEAREFMAEAIVTTEKDATKLNSESFEQPLAAVRVEFELTRGADSLETMLEALIRHPSTVVSTP